MPAQIEEATSVDDALVEAFARLVPQVSSSSPAPSREHLEALVDDPHTTVFIARADDGTIVGTLTFVVVRIPTGTRSWIEDVVVDEAARGEALGERMTEAAIEKARTLGVEKIDLTSRPSREAANHIYKKMGFQQRETNVYRFDV